jgi:PRTRC genetic system ThiF family protein
MQLDLSGVSACNVLMPFTKKTNIALVGCGGTGSWLAPHLARIYKILEEVYHHQVNMFFWDPDIVEKKNIFRQNFCEAEIGLNKAATLAARYSQAWGLNIVAIEKGVENSPFLQTGTYESRSIVVTCVDNNTTRAQVHKYCKENWDVWWMDVGNLKTAGQVAVGKMKKREDEIYLGNVTTWSPLPGFQFPQIFKKEKDIKIDMSKMSCAEMLMVDQQGLMINQLMAAMAASMLDSLLIQGDLCFHCAYVSKMGTQIVYNTPDLLMEYAEKQKEKKN